MAEKFNYKIYNKSTEKFYHGCKKSTWQQKQAVINYINDLVKQHKWRQNSDTLENIEVHIFPLSTAIVKSSSDFLNENREEIESKITKKQERELREKEASTLKHIRDLETKLENTRNELERLKNGKQK